MEGFATVQMGVKSFAALTMFGERGLYSGHVYQPDVNHRQVNFWSYHDATNTEETGSEKGGVSSVIVDREHGRSVGGLIIQQWKELHLESKR